jgi:hypothetical protein
MTALLAPSVRPYGVACATSPRTQGRGLLDDPARDVAASGVQLFGVRDMRHGKFILRLDKSPVYGIGRATSPAQ